MFQAFSSGPVNLDIHDLRLGPRDDGESANDSEMQKRVLSNALKHDDGFKTE